MTKRILLVASALLLSALPVAAQSVSMGLTVTGIVINGADANPLPLCKVQLVQGGKCTNAGFSNYAGEYRLQYVSPGSYDILVMQFGDTLMHYKGLLLEKDTWVRTVVLPPPDDGNDRPVAYDGGPFRVLRPVLIYSHRHSQLAKMGLLITSPDDPRLWNFSGQMDDLFDPDLSFWYSKYKTFYKLKAMGYNITSPFELVYPEIYHPASDSLSANYRFWILGLRF